MRDSASPVEGAAKGFPEGLATRDYVSGGAVTEQRPWACAAPAEGPAQGAALWVLVGASPVGLAWLEL